MDKEVVIATFQNLMGQLWQRQPNDSGSLQLKILAQDKRDLSNDHKPMKGTFSQLLLCDQNHPHHSTQVVFFNLSNNGEVGFIIPIVKKDMRILIYSWWEYKMVQLLWNENSLRAPHRLNIKSQYALTIHSQEYAQNN